MTPTPEIVEEEIVEEKKVVNNNLITILVLSVTLAHKVLGAKPKEGKISKSEGRKVVQAIEKAMKDTFPDVSSMLLGMFGMEMLGIMPLLNNPEKIIADMIAQHQQTIQDNVITSPKPNMD